MSIPRCLAMLAMTQLTHGMQVESKYECPQVLIEPDITGLLDAKATGKLYRAMAPAQQLRGTNASSATEPMHLFISGAANSGTTALYSLVSTSPMASNLCAGGSWACEGSWLLMDRGLMHNDTKYEPFEPKNWNRALRVFNKYWNTSKPVLVEKSPNALRKFTHIWHDLTRTGKKVSFIYLVRSLCFAHSGSKPWYNHMQEIAVQVRALRERGANVLVLRYEEMLENPFGTAQMLLDFLPALQTLDPEKSGISGHGERAEPFAEYVRTGAPFLYGNDTEPVTNVDRELMLELGYDDRFLPREVPLE